MKGVRGLSGVSCIRTLIPCMWLHPHHFSEATPYNTRALEVVSTYTLGNTVFDLQQGIEEGNEFIHRRWGSCWILKVQVEVCHSKEIRIYGMVINRGNVTSSRFYKERTGRSKLEKNIALAGWHSWLEHCPILQKVVGSTHAHESTHVGSSMNQPM